MGTPLFNTIMLIISVGIVVFYLTYIKRKYGRCSSFSRSAKKLIGKNEFALFYVFITLGISFPLALVVYNLFAAMAAGIFFMVGVITGYNPNIKNDKLEDFLHVFCVNIGIGLAAFSIIWMYFWTILLVFICFIICLFMWIFREKIPQHTWQIEAVIYWFIILSVFLVKSVMPLIELIIK